jgi:hypothetical protein
VTLPDIDSLPASREDLWAIVQKTDTEIARVEALLKELVLKQTLLKNKINYHSSPLLRIPSDITSQIFEAYLREKKGTDDKEIMHVEDDSRNALITPLFLGSVCSAWRELAWSMPWMWSSITMVLRDPLPTCANLVAEWLSRSGQCALTVRVSCVTLSKNSEVVMSILGCFSERWRHITFDLPSSSYDGLCSVQGRLPLLESMSVKIKGWMKRDTFQMFSVAPQLKVVHCDSEHPRRFMLPIAQLTSLSGYHCDITHCLDVLEVSSQLVLASFIISPSQTLGTMSLALNPHQIVAPRLQSLEVDLINGGSFRGSMLLDNLTLPDVRELSFRAGLWQESQFFEPSNFSSFILRSACPLRSLSIFNNQLDDDDLFQYMQVMPSLEELTIDGTVEITEQTIRNLTPNIPSDLPLLPNLQTLFIRSPELTVNLVELHSMLCPRRERADASSGRRVARLQSVTISCIGIHEETGKLGFPLLQQLITEGLKISVKSVIDNLYPVRFI